MTRHAGPPRGHDVPSVPEPSYAERARTLAYLVRSGALATLSRKHPGHPFASVMPYALDQYGQPLVLVSSMAMHTQNLQADPRASLLVTQPVEANAVFAVLPRRAIRALQEQYYFYVWDEAADEVRWMTTFATTEAEVDAFAEDVRAAVAGGR